jgi:cell division protein FtsA
LHYGAQAERKQGRRSSTKGSTQSWFSKFKNWTQGGL